MADELFLRDDLAEAWQGRDPFAEAFSLQGVAVRDVASRSTVRVRIGQGWFYAKRHGGVGWAEILKSLLQLKRPVLGASNEYRACRLLASRGLSTLSVAGYGCRGSNPAARLSFLITDELAPVQSLEQYCLRWPEQPPDILLKRALIERVARIARDMHGAGVNHQDFYICHLLLLHPERLSAASAPQAPIYVVDLHRAEMRGTVPARWLLKDLAALHYSTLHLPLTRRDVLRFLRTYYGRPLREILGPSASFLAKVEARARGLYRKAQRKQILARQLAGLEP